MHTPNQTTAQNEGGAQRLSLKQLEQWEALKFGMFIHFGMSTFDHDEYSRGDQPSTLYAPDRLDVDQWVSVARDAGMKYAVLTTKHVAGHCLWPSKHTDYHVGTSGNQTDVVEAFVKACEKRGVLPGFYYCSWDNRHKFGSLTPTDVLAAYDIPRGEPAIRPWFNAPTFALAKVTQAYLDFQTGQIEELLTQYGAVAEVWIDIPQVLPRLYREGLYARIAELQPEAAIMMNNGIMDGSVYPVASAWPSDLISIERFLPNSRVGHEKWREIEGKKYYLPGEVCDPIGKEWFFSEADQPRSDAELLGMYLVALSRGANLLLDVGPDPHGLIPEKYTAALRRLRTNIDKSGF